MNKLLKKHQDKVNYLFFGVLTTLVNIIVFWLFRDYFNYIINTVIAWIAAVIFAFFVNKKFVFNSSEHQHSTKKQAASFFLLRTASLAVDVLLMIVLVSVLHMNETIAKISTNFIIVFLNYGFSKYYIFKGVE